MSDPHQVVTRHPPGHGSPRPAGPRDSPRSLAADAWADLRRRRIFWAAGVLVVVILLIALFPSVFTAADPHQCVLGRQHRGPAGGALFGYDFQGCDVYARTVYGTRNSLIVGLGSVGISAVIGIVFGLAAGYLGGWIDAILSRLVDVMLAIPLLLGAIVLAGRLSSGPDDDGRLAVTVTLGLLTWTSAARVMRSSVIAAKSQDYVAAARMLGAGPARIMLRHVLPNALAPFIVVLTVQLATNIAGEATLSFLGVGLKGDAISWGTSIAEATGFVRTAAAPLVWPSVFLALTVLAFIMLGDAIRDAFDPKLR